MFNPKTVLKTRVNKDQQFIGTPIHQTSENNRYNDNQDLFEMNSPFELAQSDDQEEEVHDQDEISVQKSAKFNAGLQSIRNQNHVALTTLMLNTDSRPSKDKKSEKDSALANSS